MNELAALFTNIEGILLDIIEFGLFPLATIVFFWGVIKYLTTTEPEKMSEARTFMVFGFISLFVIFSVWGIVQLITNTFFFL